MSAEQAMFRILTGRYRQYEVELQALAEVARM